MSLSLTPMRWAAAVLVLISSAYVPMANSVAAETVMIVLMAARVKAVVTILREGMATKYVHCWQMFTAAPLPFAARMP